MADFQLIDLTSNIAFTFQYFPETVKITDRANWDSQNMTVGKKPLFYGNREPQQISVDDLYLDKTETDLSLKADLDDLRTLMDEVEGKGVPPALLALWGDQKLRCVLQDLSVDQIMFNDRGECTRARISIQLLELQLEGQAVTVTETSTYNEDINPGGG